MVVNFYNSPGERNLLNRSMNLIGTLDSVQITEPCNIETPEIYFAYDPTFLNADYVYIPQFNRYYFRNDLRIENGNFFRFYLESDPLMSFRNNIMASQCVARRSTNRINPQIRDDQVSFKVNPRYVYKELPGGFTPDGNGYCYILTLGGK